jgi:alpha 1,2-mannosyltransferase
MIAPAQTKNRQISDQHHPTTDQLLTIWTDSSPVPSEVLIKRGEQTYAAIRKQFADIGYQNTSRGIVLAAGGLSYFSSAYVLVRELRHLGCKLPIEMWYRKDEISDDLAKYMQQFGVQCLCIDSILPLPVKHKFSIKVIAMYLSSFKEILFLDADNNVLADPEFLFDCPEYREHEALFWPDYWKLKPDSPCYSNFPPGVNPVFPKFQQESGQLVINKQRYWKQLWFVFRTLESRLESLFPAPFNFGDKDLFHVTWCASGEQFTFVQHRVASVGSGIQGLAMGQHSPNGQLLFIHQNFAEWSDRTDSQGPWWVSVRTHTDPYEGSVDHGTWIPNGPTQTQDFRAVYGTIEDTYASFIQELRREVSYRTHFLGTPAL